VKLVDLPSGWSSCTTAPKCPSRTRCPSGVRFSDHRASLSETPAATFLAVQELAYDARQLREDPDRLTFLLGGGATPGLHSVSASAVRPRAKRCERSTLTPASAPAFTCAHPG
jgi:hypothetical protein